MSERGFLELTKEMQIGRGVMEPCCDYPEGYPHDVCYFYSYTFVDQLQDWLLTFHTWLKRKGF